MDDYEVKVDKRVEKTRKAIINAFKEMIIEKEFKEITIKDLAERANINRKTFYLHYCSMEDILFDFALDISELLFDILERRGYFANPSFDINILIESIDELINTNYELTKKIISANSYRFFARNIKDLVKDSLIRKYRKTVNLSDYLLNITGDFIASGLSKVLKDWFEDKGNLSSIEISKYISCLIYGAFKGALEYDKLMLKGESN